MKMFFYFLKVALITSLASSRISVAANESNIVNLAKILPPKCIISDEKIFGLDKDELSVISVPAKKIEFLGVDICKTAAPYIDNGKIRIATRAQNSSGNIQTRWISIILPDDLKKLNNDSFIWPFEKSCNEFGVNGPVWHYVSDLGCIYQPINESVTKKVCSFTKNRQEGYINAVTIIPLENMLAIIETRPGEDAFVTGVNKNTGHREWSFSIKNTITWERLTWINEHLLLATMYGRRETHYAVIDTSKHSLVARGYTDADANCFVRNGAAFVFNINEMKLSKIGD